MSLFRACCLLVVVLVVFSTEIVTARASKDSSSAGCSKSGGNFTRGTSTETIGNRSYLLSIPADYSSDTPTPLILSFHGGGQTPSIQLDADQLANGSVNDQYIVIYPEAVHTQWQVSPDSASDDLDFVTDILDKAESELCIDTSRLYATGKSQGGGMVGMLACDEILSTRIAAFAPVSGAFYVAGAQGGDECDPGTVDLPCAAGRPDIPVLEFHGGGDEVIPYYGDAGKRGACLPTIPHWVRAWARRDGLGADTNELGLVSHVYDGGNVGHVWPAMVGGDAGGGSPAGTASFDATPMILEFFGNYTLPANDTGSVPTGTDGIGGSTQDSTDNSSNLSAGSRKVATVWGLVGYSMFKSLL
ncbi:hypothetical protein KVR01_012887 [Diaporthe batatas]|uniref:uncharacterized protein n=1 Tax=Diaporthe batatas TaxID=748121 RepID=UPI001D04C4DD|nr:uncharacterized protein KVR01_012887 [Diaporthe batatas]KAG8157179.1 hypothetical protein KVR01_012887 [Diaporthe batatas]